MRRILTYLIDPDAAGQSILTFLKEKRYSRTVITQLKKTKNGIQIDEKWAYVNHILKEDERLTILLTEPEEQLQLHDPDENRYAADIPNILPTDLPVHIVYEDEDLLVVDKSAGMPIHPSMGNHKNTLANAVRHHAVQRQEYYPYRCVNRLDRDTSGLTIIAKNAYSSCILYEQMRARAIRRTYYAIAQGNTPASGTIHAPIARQKDTILERTVRADGEEAVTHFQTLARSDGLSFLKLWLDTGRTHQIRVHMSYIGHPLIGDFLYNPKDSRMKRQALHAGNLSFAHPVTGQTLQFSAPLPTDMLQFFDVVIS